MIVIPNIETFDAPVKLREKYIKAHFPELYNCVQKCDGLTMSEKLYQYYHGMTTAPLCKNCGLKKTVYRGLKIGYSIYCCNQCNAKDEDRREKSKQTKLERYGDPYYTNHEKSKQTKLERYGDPYYFDQEKMKQTLLSRYGVENASQSLVLKDKMKSTIKNRTDEERNEICRKISQTKLERYGDEHYNNIDKIKQTKLERYGDSFYTNIDKMKQTCIDRYGVSNPMKNEYILQKVKQTNITRYGVEFPMLNHRLTIKNIDSRKQYYIRKHDLIDIEDNWIWVCKCPHPECSKCSDKFYKITSQQFYGRLQHNIEPCTNILPIHSNSGTGIELFVRDILDAYCISYICNDRTILAGKELDIYIPSHNIAIECNGVYWHSRYESNYHMDKFNKCSELGIQLITIWEDQIHTNPELIKSMILSKLGIYQERIYARNCIIKNLSSHDCAQFLNNHHIQGATKTKVRKGLYHNAELVAVMTFSFKSKMSGSKQDSDEWVLSRFCTKQNTQILGGADKLLKSFIKEYHPHHITSFASNDISNGNLYKRLGFKQGQQTSAYWYIHKDNYQRYHRTSFTKDRLIKMGYDKDKTEEEIMKDLPYYKIYDSGHVKYTLEL